MLNIRQILEEFANKNVLIIGDVMVDRYLSGKATRMSPEAPVPVVDLKEQVNRLGGAANVALNIRSFGATPFLVSIIGKDLSGEQLLQLLPENKISEKYIIQSSTRRTTVKTRVIANQQHLLRVDDEDQHDLDAQEAKMILDQVKNILDSNKIDVILFQDYNKGVLSLPVISNVLMQAIKKDIPTVVDPKFKNFWAYKDATLIKPNLKEIRKATGRDLAAKLNDLWETHRILQSKLGIKYSLITLSEKGIFAADNETKAIIQTQKRDIVDVCGAGDSVISVAALGLAISLDIHDIALLSNLAGGQVCEHVGVVPLNPQLLETEYKELIT